MASDLGPTEITVALTKARPNYIDKILRCAHMTHFLRLCSNSRPNEAFKPHKLFWLSRYIKDWFTYCTSYTLELIDSQFLLYSSHLIINTLELIDSHFFISYSSHLIVKPREAGLGGIRTKKSEKTRTPEKHTRGMQRDLV